MTTEKLSKVTDIAEKYGCRYSHNEPIAPYTTFGIGGRCALMIHINGADVLCELVPAMKENDIPYYVIGKGSNILADDKDIDMVMLHIGKDMSGIHTDGNRLICEAGAVLSAAAATARDNSLAGMEFAHGIPGNVGGAVFMNAGAYGGEIKDIIEYAEAVTDDGKLIRFEKNDMALDYRHSVFCDNRYIITKAAFVLESSDKTLISDKMAELAAKRKEKQPLEFRSAGSTFKRPKGTFAALLIEQCGLKGYSCGDAQVSEKHSGFVINRGNASFEDVMKVIGHVKETVYSQTGIMLECEPEMILSE